MSKNLIINEMLTNNIHLGHKKNLLDVSMKKYVININKKIHIINLEMTLKALKTVLNILKNIKKLDQKILILCVEKKTRTIIKKAAKSINMPYVNKRWLGGSFTNFETLSSAVNSMNYMKNMLRNKIFKIKKKRKRILKKKLKKIKSFLDGVSSLKKIPEYIFIVNVKRHKNAIKESKKMGVISIAINDTNNSTKNIDYVIPGNDDSYKSIIFYIKKIINTIKNEK